MAREAGSGSAGFWAVGQATWVWYEHLARRELPFPSLAHTGFAYLTQEGAYRTGAPTDVGWFAGCLLVAAAALRPAAVGITWVGRRPGRFQILLPYSRRSTTSSATPPATTSWSRWPPAQPRRP